MDRGRLNVSLHGAMLVEVEHFKYLGSQIAREGGVEVDVIFGVGGTKGAAGTVRKLWKNEGLGVKAEKMSHEEIVVPTALYVTETWSLREAERRKLNIFEMRCLRSM